MAEWSNAHDSKSCYVGTRTGVRIPLSAPNAEWADKSLPIQRFKAYQPNRSKRLV